MYFLPYNKNLKEFSRELRQHSTLGEVLLWKEIRAKKIMGYTFNRQKPIGNYIVDFYCKPLNLVIEIDGNSHYHEAIAIKDEKKQELLESFGLFLIRFPEKNIRFKRIESLQVIVNVILELEAQRKKSRPVNPPVLWTTPFQKGERLDTPLERRWHSKGMTED